MTKKKSTIACHTQHPIKTDITRKHTSLGPGIKGVWDPCTDCALNASRSSFIWATVFPNWNDINQKKSCLSNIWKFGATQFTWPFIAWWVNIVLITLDRQGWNSSVYKRLSSALSFNNRREVSNNKQANTCTEENHWRAWESIAASSKTVLPRWIKIGRFVHSHSTTFTHFLFKPVRPAFLFFFPNSTFLPNLSDFSTQSAESGSYCLPFFSLSHSDSN